MGAVFPERSARDGLFASCAHPASRQWLTPPCICVQVLFVQIPRMKAVQASTGDDGVQRQMVVRKGMGYCFVEYSSVEEARAAAQATGLIIDSKPLKVMAKDAWEKSKKDFRFTPLPSSPKQYPVVPSSLRASPTSCILVLIPESDACVCAAGGCRRTRGLNGTQRQGVLSSRGLSYALGGAGVL